VAETTAASDATTPVRAQPLVDRLRELIHALDARVPHLERNGELQIASDAAALKTKALARIADLEKPTIE
jgi:hypothetical protein